MFVVAVLCFAGAAVVLADNEVSADSTGTYVDPIKRGDIATENATISFVKDDGSEYSYKNGNTDPLMNSKLGNTGLAIEKINNNTVKITGNLNKQDRNDNGIGAQFAATGAPDGMDYAILFNLADVVDGDGDYGFGSEGNPVYIYYTNSQDNWKTLTKTGSTSTQLVYINSERATGSTTYYISAQKDLTSETVKSTADVKTFTIQYDFTLGAETDASDISSALESADVVTVTGGEISSTVTVGANKTLNIGQNVTMGENAEFDIAEGGIVTVDSNAEKTFSVKGGDGTETEVAFTKVTGTFSITGGSVIVDGNLAGQMDIKGSGDDYVVISGAVIGDLTITQKGVSQNDKVVFNNVTVNPGVTIYMDDGIEYSVEKPTGAPADQKNSYMNLYGSLAAYVGVGETVESGSQVTVSVAGDNTFTAYTNSKINYGVQIVGDGKIDTSAAMSTMTVNDDIESPFFASQSQKVIVQQTVTIKAGWSMTILGELEIADGVTLYIENGASLIIGQSETTTITAQGMTVAGNIEVMEGGIIKVNAAKAVDVSGEILSSGTVEINSAVTIENGGSIIIDDYDGSSLKVTQGLTVNAGGTLTVSKEMDVKGIENKGTVVLDGAVLAGAAGSTITMAGDKAVVDIKSFTSKGTSNTLTVTDKDLVFPNKDKNSIENKFVFTADIADVGAKGVVITEFVTSEVKDGDTVYGTYMTVSGSLAVQDNRIEIPAEDNNGCIVDIAAGYKVFVPVDQTLTIGNKMTVSVSSGTFAVDGTVLATAQTSKVSASGTGVIDVTGLVQTFKEITSNINAFQYTAEAENGDDNFYYTNLTAAVASGAETIKYMGKVDVTESVTIPAGVTLRPYKTTTSGADSFVTIGSFDDRDVTVTVSAGATIYSSHITVNGSLVFEDNRKDNRSNTITSDVMVDEAEKRTYTNIYTALQAETGTITITGLQVILDKDIEVKQDVTLVIPVGSTVIMYNDVTLTVNGTVRNSGSIVNQIPDVKNEGKYVDGAGFNPETDHNAAIVVNGVFMSINQIPYEQYYIAGANYQLINSDGSWYYFAPVETAASVANDVVNGAITVYGKNTASDVTFTGDEQQAVTVTVQGALEASSITLSYATISVQNGASFTGTIGNGVGTVQVTNAEDFSVQSVVDNEGTEVLYLAGAPKASDVDMDSAMTVATGTVNSGALSIDTTKSEIDQDYIDSFAIAEGAVLTVSVGTDGKTVTLSADNMTVDGTLVSDNGGKVTVTGILTVRGTFSVLQASQENGTAAGQADVATLYVGIAAKDGKFGNESAATVTADSLGAGNVKIVASAESTVTGDLTKGMKSTGFYVEDSLWMTVYVNANNNTDKISERVPGSDKVQEGTSYNYQPADLSECLFVSWKNADGKALTGDVLVGSYGADRVYAEIDYNVYTVVVLTDGGIASVAIDGNLLTQQFGSNTFVASDGLRAGQHTITYTLKSGFTGTAVLTADGVSVSGNTFTLSGDFSKDIVLNLAGTEPKDTTIVVDGGNSGNDGLGLTDYLLIVLVVLIVIMAIIVAMRLMRS